MRWFKDSLSTKREAAFILHRCNTTLSQEKHVAVNAVILILIINLDNCLL